MIPVSEHIACFRANNPSPFTLDGTNCYVVSGARDALLVDVGPDEAAHLRALTAYLDARALVLRAILLTHTHSDHTEGLGAFRQRMPAPAYAFAPGYDHRLRDAERIVLEGQALTVVHTPGHSADSVCFYYQPDGVLFSGDTVLGEGTSVLSPADGDVGDYLDSLERLTHLDACAIAPGHGPVIEDPPAKLREYIEHRAMRERQIVAELQGGPKTIPAMVAVIYKDVVPGLHQAAERSVLAHLKRMARLGQVRNTGDLWRLVEDH